MKDDNIYIRHMIEAAEELKEFIENIDKMNLNQIK